MKTNKKFVSISVSPETRLKLRKIIVDLNLKSYEDLLLIVFSMYKAEVYKNGKKS